MSKLPGFRRDGSRNRGKEIFEGAREKHTKSKETIQGISPLSVKRPQRGVNSLPSAKNQKGIKNMGGLQAI